VLAGALATAVTVGLAACVLWLPDPAPTLAVEAAANLGATGVGNPITGVLMAFRALDTLLEATVLLFAVIGVWSLAPDRFWGGRPGPAHGSDPDGILAYLGRILPPIGIVIAIYILWVGADAPGGKFQGATILAAMWLLVIMAGLADVPPVSRRALRLGLVAGPAVFIALGFVGAAAAGAFLGWPSGLEKAFIVAIEVALLPSLALTLGLLLSGAPQRPPS
jgi:multisubunit Na+/H+ antiporter MnhB subunit